MKQKSPLLLLSVFALVLGLAAGVARAADPLQVAPDMYKLVYENDRVRVMQVTFKPGQKIAAHSHPDHYVYVLEGGTLKISHPDGTSGDANLAVGQVVWIAAETHWAENTGTTTVRLLVNELKEPRPKAKKK